MKIGFFNKRLIQEYYSILSALSVITSLIFIFIDISAKYKIFIGLVTLTILIAVYIGRWIYANKRTIIHLSIASSSVEIKYGDLFNEDGLKVIAFNEYFDTKVDEKVIASSTLNGFYIREKIEDIRAFDEQINTDSHLSKRIKQVNYNRNAGKRTSYKLGSIFVHNDFLLTAFSHFDDDNRAYLTMQDYINFLLEFWNEVDIRYAGRTVVIPLLGSGITRFKGCSISEQELLELLLWSFKTSRIKFRYPSKLKIVLDIGQRDKISLSQLTIFDDKKTDHI
jgi:hypothetical protein